MTRGIKDVVLIALGSILTIGTQSLWGHFGWQSGVVVGGVCFIVLFACLQIERMQTRSENLRQAIEKRGLDPELVHSILHRLNTRGVASSSEEYHELLREHYKSSKDYYTFTPMCSPMTKYHLKGITERGKRDLILLDKLYGKIKN